MTKELIPTPQLRGGGANSPHSLESKKVDSTDIDFKAEITSNNDSKILQGKEQVDKAEAESTSQDDSKILQEKAQVDKAEAESTSKWHSSILDEKCGLQEKVQGSYLKGNDRRTFSSLPHLSPKDECQEIILDFFAGSGTTAHAVMELNREDGGNRKAILVTNNEKTELNPNGIAYDVTTKRLKRIMSGECYDGDKGFKWLEKNTPYGDGLEVLDIEESPSDMDTSIFDKIDERLYGLDFTDSKQEKIKWVCENFESTCKSLESKQDSSAFSKAHKESILHTDNGDSTKEDK
nr:DNA methyltransferase [Helicobacter sp. 10-6591]